MTGKKRPYTLSAAALAARRRGAAARAAGAAEWTSIKVSQPVVTLIDAARGPGESRDAYLRRIHTVTHPPPPPHPA